MQASPWPSCGGAEQPTGCARSRHTASRARPGHVQAASTEVDVAPQSDPTTNGSNAAATLDGKDGSPLVALLQLLAERNRQLETALESRLVIEQAKRVLIDRISIESQQAFDTI